ncbi:hypothetical protein NUW54_g9516 [Trametes sanguinea]|uniref:Uncharacterized protein n=1 Tax=Trametes sanguinea TaxID=158606 RepID=A0ACC1P6H9_9APHY|nr:hypothetical protein NUW54_g9516 [Trametes sanguinea]
MFIEWSEIAIERRGSGNHLKAFSLNAEPRRTELASPPTRRSGNPGPTLRWIHFKCREHADERAGSSLLASSVDKQSATSDTARLLEASSLGLGGEWEEIR